MQQNLSNSFETKQRIWNDAMKLSESKSILLFRYHDNPEQAREKIRILRHFNPTLDIHVLDGGYPPHYAKRKRVLEDVADSVWLYEPNKTPSWKWRHTYQLVKDWYRTFGHTLEFDFLYSYEYDLLTLVPLLQIYPDIDDNSIALGGVTKLTDDVIRQWVWTNGMLEKIHRELDFRGFERYMAEKYDVPKQSLICAGPGTLLSRRFLDRWADTEDISLVHEEILYPALAEAFSMDIVDHGMHPGADDDAQSGRYFNCAYDGTVTKDMVQEQLTLADGRRAFHPVKEMITLEDLGALLR